MNVDQVSGPAFSKPVSLIHDVTATQNAAISGCAKSENLPAQKRYSMYTVTMWYCILMNFKNISKFINFIEF